MNCPKCGIVLKIADRQGVEVDYCPACRGIWLDRGELDKIIDRSLRLSPNDADMRHNETSSYTEKRKRGKIYNEHIIDDGYYDDDDGYYHPPRYQQSQDKYYHNRYKKDNKKHYKKKSLIKELLDIFD